ncbi:Bacterial type II secretion system protein F domain protein [Marinobacter litoralis]|uniref:Bacterial type II secretion system protein F domain protein n=1 Tax=Marinobacter litoralis TaxID=187981 RepID=A0A3M2RKD6_9GAMM|nr:type II secretion system F family protein [Marinobacter litoralis]RMJ05619.1 Bacterial type II secretion system protein F domain protein [Marinobacter litoralis]
MVNLWFIGAIVLAMASVLYLWVWGPAWALQARVRARLSHRQLTTEDETGSPPLETFVYWLVDRPLLSGDFKELEPALDATGKTPYRARQYYILLCWVVPFVLTLAAIVFSGVMTTAVTFMMSFYLSRQFIRSSGRTAEKQQNRESIELCQMTRMLMEAGLSPERSLKLISHQARELMPLLVTRIDRFNRVMESGADRSRALDELGRNRNLTVLRSYVTLMKQAGTLGAGVSGALEQIVTEAHHEERSKLKEETNKVGARMTIIMMVFMLPSLFILIGGPAVLSIMDALQR